MIFPARNLHLVLDFPTLSDDCPIFSKYVIATIPYLPMIFPYVSHLLCIIHHLPRQVPGLGARLPTLRQPGATPGAPALRRLGGGAAAGRCGGPGEDGGGPADGAGHR